MWAFYALIGPLALEQKERAQIFASLDRIEFRIEAIEKKERPREVLVRSLPQRDLRFFAGALLAFVLTIVFAVLPSTRILPGIAALTSSIATLAIVWLSQQIAERGKL